MIVFIRKLLDHVFTKKELQVLDDMLPDFHRNNRLDDEEALKVIYLRFLFICSKHFA